MKKTVSLILAIIMTVGIFTAVPFTAGAETVIDEVNITDVTVPIAGLNADFYADTTDSGYTITDVGWRNGSSWMEEDSEFKSFVEYTVYVYITADEGYQFKVDGSGNCAVTAYLNGNIANVNIDDAKKNLVVTYSYVASTDPDYTYNVINGDKAEIIGYKGTEPIISIPSSIDGYKVTKIGNAAFFDNDNLEEVVFPDTLEVIGDNAFGDCSSLTDITFRDGLKKINFIAFECCDSLTSVDIPETVEYIGDSAFASCHALREVWLYEGLLSIGGHAFYDCENLMEASVPDSAFQILDYAFGYKYDGEKKVPVDGFVLSGYADSAAENYAKNHDLTFEKLSLPVTVQAKTTMFTYNGKTKKPTVTVTDMRGDKLVEGTDYTLVYPKSSVNVGSYIVDINLKGKYSGVEYVLYVIKPAKNPMTVKGLTKAVKYATVKKKNVTVTALSVKKAKGAVTYKKLSGNKKIIVNKKTGKFTVKKGLKKGTYAVKVKVSVKGDRNHSSATKTVTAKIKVK